MDLGDDLRIDLGRWTLTITARTAIGRGDRGIANRALVDPLFGLAGFDLLALALGGALRSTRTTGLADLLGSTFRLRARLGTTAILLTALFRRSALWTARAIRSAGPAAVVVTRGATATLTAATLTAATLATAPLAAAATIRAAGALGPRGTPTIVTLAGTAPLAG